MRPAYAQGADSARGRLETPTLSVQFRGTFAPEEMAWRWQKAILAEHRAERGSQIR